MKNLVNYIKESYEKIHLTNVKAVFDINPEVFTLTGPEIYSESDIQIYLGDVLLKELPSENTKYQNLLGKNKDYINDAYFEYEKFEHSSDTYEDEQINLKWDAYYDERVKDEKIDMFKLTKLKYIILFDEFELLDKNDDEPKNNPIRKEINDILNTDYSLISINTNTPSKTRVKRKRVQTYIKKKYVKRKSGLFSLKIKDEGEDKEYVLQMQKKREEMEEELKKEKLRDQKIYEFFERIQRLKKTCANKFEFELNSFIDEQIEKKPEVEKDANGGRLNLFLQDFQSNRIRAKYNVTLKNKKYGFISPIIFTSPNESNIFKMKK